MLGWLIAFIQLLGLVTAARAIMEARTAQGAVAWAVALVSFITALQLAALRGVEVRILIPERSNHPLVSLSGWSYMEELEKAGIRVYRYHEGFMHQKVTLIDENWCTVGTANFDNRSFRLNFEITMAVADREFAQQVRAMLEEDFARARRVTTDDLRARSFAFRFAVRAARLAAPVQ